MEPVQPLEPAPFPMLAHLVSGRYEGRTLSPSRSCSAVQVRKVFGHELLLLGSIGSAIRPGMPVSAESQHTNFGEFSSQTIAPSSRGKQSRFANPTLFSFDADSVSTRRSRGVEGRVVWQNDGRSVSDLELGVTLRADQHRFDDTQSAYAHGAGQEWIPSHNGRLS